MRLGRLRSALAFARRFRRPIGPADFVWMFGFGRTGSSWLARMLSDGEGRALWPEPAGRDAARRRSWAARLDRGPGGACPGGAAGEPRLRPRGRGGAPGGGPPGADGRRRPRPSPHVAGRRPPDPQRPERLDGRAAGGRGVPRGPAPRAGPGSAGRAGVDTRLPPAGGLAGAALGFSGDQELFDVDGFSQGCAAALGAALEAHRLHRGRKALVTYEELLADTGPVLERACRALGLDPPPGWIERVVEAHHWDNIAASSKGPGRIFRRATPGTWSEVLTPEEVGVIERNAAEVIERFYAR